MNLHVSKLLDFSPDIHEPGVAGAGQVEGSGKETFYQQPGGER